MFSAPSIIASTSSPNLFAGGRAEQARHDFERAVYPLFMPIAVSYLYLLFPLFIRRFVFCRSLDPFLFVAGIVYLSVAAIVLNILLVMQ